MKIGIIVYSQTGNTLSVARRIAGKLTGDGHLATLEEIKSEGDPRQGLGSIKFTACPDPGPYDAVVFGAPVMAFSLNPVMTAYMKRMSPLNGKKTAFIVTQHFPYAWMGGNRAVGKMAKLCTEKGADIKGHGIVNWKRSDREDRIDTVVELFSKLFQ